MLSLQTCLVGVLVSLSLFQLAATDKSIGVREIQRKFEDYALGFSTSTGLKMADLRRAAEQYESLPEEETDSMLEGNPTMQLFEDFVIRPMRFEEFQIEDKPSDTHKYVERAEKAYKSLRPAYLGKQVPPYTRAKSFAFNKILQTVLGKRSKQDLTVEDFILAKKEYEAWIHMLDEIVTYQDVYASAGEIKKIFNYINDPKVKKFKKACFDYIKPGADVKELYRKFYNAINGGLFVVMSV